MPCVERAREYGFEKQGVTFNGVYTMSTLVGVRKNGEAALAFDTMNHIAGTISVGGSARKAFRAGNSIIGTAGFAVYQNVLPHYIQQLEEVGELSTESSVFEFFIAFWRALHRRYHFVNDSSDSDRPSPFADLDAEFLVANKHGVFRVKEILSVLRFEHYCAIGSGAPEAEGALSVLYDGSDTASEIARRAVEVGCAFDCSSGGAIEILEVR